jgi:RNA 2',3'-cyclic 3'-phosphodiesterase
MGALERIRLFVAIFPPLEIARGLAEAGRDLLGRELSPGAVAWIRPEQIHLTLHFLGSVERGRVEGIERAVETACRRGEPCLLRARGLGCFPSPSRARVVWAGLGGAAEVLGELKHALDESLARLGHAPEKRPFHPHLTVGRVKMLKSGDRRHLAATLPQWCDTDFGDWTVERVDLMQSVLLPTGAEYGRVQSFPLALSGS